jgi:hypothetical protein
VCNNSLYVGCVKEHAILQNLLHTFEGVGDSCVNKLDAQAVRKNLPMGHTRLHRIRQSLLRFDHRMEMVFGGDVLQANL